MLMGATLPAVARCLSTTRSGVSRLGFLYMANLAGGVAGCLLAGFYLLRLYDGIVATLFAVSLNVAVAAAAFWISSRAGSRATDVSKLTPPSLAKHRTAYLVIALSGLTALGAQVVWTRVLGLILGGTVFSFTIILAIFLAGLTPIPYKVFTLSAGVFAINFPVFLVASVFSRGLRFFVLAGLIFKFGKPIESFIDRYFNLLVTVFGVLLIAGFLLIEFVL